MSTPPTPTPQELLEALKQVKYPGFNRDIVAFGVVKDIAVGGAAFLVSKAIRSARTVAFEDLGMEAIYEFEVEDMPVTVAVDSEGDSVHESGPKLWRQRIADIPVTVS